MEKNEFYCKGFLAAPAPPPPPSPGPGWERAGAVAWADETLERAFRRSRGGFVQAEAGGGFSLAYPLSCRLPFPLPPLFCFARAECLQNRGWWVFSFGPGGVPRFDEKP